MEPDNNSFDAAIRAHDQAVEASGLDVWIGAEPTFTNRQSESPEWLSEALGATKPEFACRIIQKLRDCYPCSIILRTLGRQYAGEPQPRWSLGLYLRRDGRALADRLPPDPLSEACTCKTQDMIAFWQSLADQLDCDGRAATAFQVNGDMGLRREQDETGVVFITGLRYRAFAPWAGLHPGLGEQTPIVLYLLPPDGDNGLRCTLHDWQPEGEPYDGLPDDLDEARRRIAQRFVVENITVDKAPDAVDPADEAVSDYCLDLRRT